MLHILSTDLLMYFLTSTIGMSIARVVTIFNTDFTDFTSNTYNFTWSMIEFGVAILVACAPILRPLFGKLLPFPTTSHRNGAKTSIDHESFKRLDDLRCDHSSEGTIPLHPFVGPSTNTVVSTNAQGRLADNLLHEHVRSPSPVWNGSGSNARSVRIESCWDVDYV